MALSLSGTLQDPYGNPLPGAVIRFDSVATSTAVLRHVHAEATTDSSGKYSIQVEHGRYNIRVQQGRSLYDLARNVLVNADTSAETLNQLIADAEFYDELTPQIILQFIELRDETRGYRDESQAAAASANANAQAAAADVSDMLTQAVAESADRAADQADRATLEADRANTYADNAGYVTRERLRKQATLDLDFAGGDYALDDGEKLRTTNAGEVLTVERATPKWVFGPNGKLREVPPNTIARQWNPETGEPEGVLIEESRTNLLLWSEDFTNAAWTKEASSIEADVIEAPDGSLTADKLVEDTGSGSHYVRWTGNFTAGVTYTLSVFFRPAERSAATIIMGSGAFGSTISVTFDIAAGVIVGTPSSGVGDYSLEKYSGGYYRASVTATAQTTTSTVVDFRLYDTVSGSNNYTGDGTSGIYIWGAQLEEGSQPSSYIPTEDAPVTRAADNVTRVLGEEFNPSAFTHYLVFEGIPYTDDPNSHLMALAQETASAGTPRVSCRVTRNTFNIQIVSDDGTVWLSDGIGGSLNSSGLNKVAVAINAQEGTLSVAVNGGIAHSESGLSGTFNNIVRLWLSSSSAKSNNRQHSDVLIPRTLSESELVELTS